MSIAETLSYDIPAYIPATGCKSDNGGPSRLLPNSHFTLSSCRLDLELVHVSGSTMLRKSMSFPSPGGCLDWNKPIMIGLFPFASLIMSLNLPFVTILGLIFSWDTLAWAYELFLAHVHSQGARALSHFFVSIMDQLLNI